MKTSLNAINAARRKNHFRVSNGANSQQITLKLPEDLLESLRVISEREHRSISGQVTHYLRQVIPSEPKDQ